MWVEPGSGYRVPNNLSESGTTKSVWVHGNDTLAHLAPGRGLALTLPMVTTLF